MELTKDFLVVEDWVEVDALPLNFASLVKEGKFPCLDRESVDYL